MNNLKVVKVDQDSIQFENGIQLYSYHEYDCCEHHYLSFGDLTIDDFEGLRFDLSKDEFFKKIDGYGIELMPIQGHSVRVPGYGSNNGYYSSNLSLVIAGSDFRKVFDITECQEVSD